MQEHIPSTEFGPGLAAFLGLIEGLTELLPISSTGHLILAGHLLGFTGEMAISVDICIQLGSILAIFVYEREKIFTLLRAAFSEQMALRHHIRTTPSSQGSDTSWTARIRQSWNDHPNLWFVIGLGIAFSPAAVIGLLTHTWIEAHLFSPSTVAVSLIVGGIILYVVELKPRPIECSQLHQVGVKTAFIVGLAQCAALIPGMSRSGSTIVGGLLSGLDRKVATEYSFFLALPTMFAATLYKLVQSLHLFSASDAFALFIGTLVSFVVTWIVIALFLTYVKRHTLQVFAVYRIILGLLLLVILNY
ncbi:MAG: undecaprenyl-diphosphate phosphatase [Nitrospirae bacterium]|nr:undecaprenyl-diphosphate phosphatase [Nitrospirota bacterium]